ncbi:MAG: NAD(P)/FAD-dependent oxidoreductase [Muribaculaceae bacterium]|nr:NAD(P)/FAD-dependent oxidoreductase [Muribaculaceae bacterium]
MIQDIDIRTTPQIAATPELLRKECLRLSGMKGSELHDLRIVRRSIDARQRNVMVNLRVRLASGSDSEVPNPCPAPPSYPALTEESPSVIIVGAGPAGLFAALTALENGVRPIVLERGADVDERRSLLAAISRTGQVDPNTNYSFGEGGAGAYSDGKLYTRSKKRGPVEKVLATFVNHGANPDILIDAHPHIGSDKLPQVIKSMRETIIARGGQVNFHKLVDELIQEDDRVVGVRCSDGSAYQGPVILAIGHSARDTYRMLHSAGIPLQAKGLAIGVRLEHPQELIDKIQYHSTKGRGKYLPAAEYSFVEQVDGRGVYSFCMCPGGVIVPAATAPGQLVVNGMSASARSSRWANSGMVVEVHPGDIPGYKQHGPLEMMEVQEYLEHTFFMASGNTLRAPAQRMVDFCNNRISGSLPPSSYVPGLMPLPIHTLLPSFISKRLQEGFRKFGRKSRGFLTNDAALIGLESRTSSPVRIPRDSQTMMHEDVPGLYPAGEGAGYAGGIVSAAIDGIRAAQAATSKPANS